MITGVGHIGIFVKNIEESVKALSKFVDLTEPSIKESEKMGVKVGVINLGGFELELIQDLKDDGPLAQFVGEKGDMIHHFCLLSNDIDKDLVKLEERGVELADPTPKVGARGKRIAMTSPTAFNGIAIELSEP